MQLCEQPIWPAQSAIAIDVPIFAHKFVYTERTINGLMRRMLEFAHELVALQARPVFVFDGDKLPLKDAERRYRADVRNKELAKAKIRQSNAIEAIAHGLPGPTDDIVIKISADFFKTSNDETVVSESAERQFGGMLWPTATDYTEMFVMLQNHGYDVVKAKYEAEALCAHLSATDQVWAVLTEDSDVLAFGAKRAIFKYTSSTPVMINREHMLQKLQLTYNQFVDLCCMLGCDFCDNVYMMGPVTAYKALQHFGSWSAVYVSICNKTYTWPSAMNCSKTMDTARELHNIYDQVALCFKTRAHEISL